MNTAFCSGDDEMYTVVSCVVGTEREDARESEDGKESGVSDPVALARIRESEDGEESGVSDLEDPRRRCSSTVNVTLTPRESISVSAADEPDM
ncbi:hypothetical protein Bca4012_099770 [Brassica carinata]|uniref:Uncharacterized protein n=2 Tax=Brassica TaxID=3705 RepID=A0A8X7PJR1_BRACI|nr:hypothetical protein Bca52824_082344 [Brassica carinata]VDD62193.1 unnamed protein product [Brassica oleracea]